MATRLQARAGRGSAMRWQLRLHAVWAWACAQSRKILNAAAINNPCQSNGGAFRSQARGECVFNCVAAIINSLHQPCNASAHVRYHHAQESERRSQNRATLPGRQTCAACRRLGLHLLRLRRQAHATKDRRPAPLQAADAALLETHAFALHNFATPARAVPCHRQAQ